MPTMIRAVETTTNILSGTNARDVSSGIHYLYPNASPLLSVITKAAKRKKVATNSKFEWFEKDNLPDKDQINNGAGYASGDTALVVDNGAYFRPNDVIHIPRTGENLRVTSISTNTLTVVRAFGSTAAAAINDNDDVFILGSAWAEGADPGTPLSHQGTNPHNFTEIFRTQFGASRTQQNTDAYTGNDRKRMRMEYAKEHKLAIERAFLWGERKEVTTDTNAPYRATGGLEYWTTENNKDAAGTLTEAELEDWLEDIFQVPGSSDERLCVASPLIISVLDQLAAARQMVAPKEDTFGVAVKEYVTAHGTLLLAKHRLLINGVTDGYSGVAYAVDPGKLVFRPLQNSDTKLNTDIQTPGADKFVDEYLTECGLEFQNPKCHGKLYGVTG